MQITTGISGGLLEIRIVGRLDNDSAGELSATIDEVLRQGNHAAVVDLREVEYMSSAGLGALLRAHKRFKAVHGAFGVVAAASHVEEVIRLSGVAKLLMVDPAEAQQWGGGRRTTLMPSMMVAASAGLQFEIYELQRDAKLECRVWGDPRSLAGGRVDPRQCRSVPLASDSLGLGIAALGKDFADCADRFGEFLAVGGGVAVQPTPAGRRPDYQLATGSFVPRPHLLYGVSCVGKFARMIRFTPDAATRRVPFSELVDPCLKHSKASVAALVFVAETAGLIGASLRRSPATGGAAAFDFGHPQIRDWLSFTPEHEFPHTLVVIVGIAARRGSAEIAAPLASLLRPLGENSEIDGHFHAAVFSYRPLKKRSLNLQETVASLFDSEDLQAVLHLINDQRAISGGGESELVGGACWVGPLGRVVAGEDR